MTLDGAGSTLIVGAHGKNYFIEMCGYHEELSGDGRCMKLEPGKFSIDN